METTTDQQEIQPNVPKKKSYKGLIITIIILAILVVVGLGYFLVQKAVSKQNEEIVLENEAREQAVQNLFSAPDYSKIPDEYKRHIYNFLEYNNLLDGSFFMTKIADRAKNVFAFGDFTSDDNEEDDMAVLLESSDFKSSKLVIFNHKGELLYIEDYINELPTINSYKVGSKIYMNETELVPSPCDGIIVKNQYTKKAVVYDKKDKIFNTFYQYTKEEIEAMDSEGDYEEEYYEGESATEAIEEPSATAEPFVIEELK